MSEMNKNGNFEMQDLVNLIGANAETVKTLAGAMGNMQRDVKTVKDKVSSMEDSFAVMRQDIADIKENEEINFSQQQNIRKAVSKRVYFLLNIPHNQSERTIADKVNINKYVGLFCRRCYGDTQRRGHLGDPYRTTTKKNYDAAMSDIEAWRPSNGVDALKREADDNALARKIAKEQGYLDQAEREVTEHGDK